MDSKRGFFEVSRIQRLEVKIVVNLVVTSQDELDSLAEWAQEVQDRGDHVHFEFPGLVN